MIIPKYLKYIKCKKCGNRAHLSGEDENRSEYLYHCEKCKKFTRIEINISLKKLDK